VKGYPETIELLVGHRRGERLKMQETETETAVSLNFKHYSREPGIVVDSRTNKKYIYDSLDTKILVYEDRVTAWFFSYGIHLQSHHNAGFFVLQIALAQIEGIEQYRRGQSSENQSGHFVREGLKRIFGLDESSDDWLKDFYTLVRCGLFHDGMTRTQVSIENRFAIPLAYDGSHILISPNKFLDAVIENFTHYIAELKNPLNADLREAFQRNWDRRCNV
jgi:hypothetical protein